MVAETKVAVYDIMPSMLTTRKQETIICTVQMILYHLVLLNLSTPFTLVMCIYAFKLPLDICSATSLTYFRKG